ncbi:MAG TPA: ABC transporter ATP-binding protein [Cerasibacillus sp.]|uniref:ABC transporter ATP-binding protein n=1 Tax=Cerasibacillus sp. TaxID=2498711 RepID=UPI002F41355A
MKTPALELINVTKRIGNKEIIKGLQFKIDKGEVFGFIGPNGAGKTTTIRMIVGLMSLTEGDIRIHGKSIKTNYKEAVREIGAIVENPELYPYMTGWQNLKHFARMIPGITDERIKEIISLVKMEKTIHEKVKRYSLGMRQRLGIAQALLHNPSILILDEPTNGLDPAGIREIREYIRALAKEENVAIIISSHLLSEIEQMCDRIGIIKNGELITTQSVHDTEDEEQSKTEQIFLFDIKPAKKAQEVLESEFDAEVDHKDGILTVKTTRENVPEMIKTLVKHDMAIYQVAASKSTLEDKFFDLIGENIIE